MDNGLGWKLVNAVPNGVGNGPQFGHGLLERVPGFEKMNLPMLLSMCTRVCASEAASGEDE